MSYTPKNLNLWTRPSNYMGATWEDYYIFLSRNRDSDDLQESNFEYGLKEIGGEGGEIPNEYKDAGENSRSVARESHWACGWIELIYIHKTDYNALRIADKLMSDLESYPILNEDDFSEREIESANDVWLNCYDWEDRIKYIRNNRNQFDFHDFSDLLAVVRGKYFNGYASELLH